MDNELENKLKSRFNFYRQDFGFECGDGWFQILWDLSLGIEKELKKEFTIDEFAKSYLTGQPVFNVRQVKEKFGTLRYHYDRLDDGDEISIIDELISKAENKTFTTCERCGQPGKMRSNGWKAVLCDECNKKEKKCSIS